MPGLEYTSRQNELLGRLGVEIWRLNVRFQTGRTDRLSDSIERLTDVFAQLGGVIQDRTGTGLVDGDAAEIIGTTLGDIRGMIVDTIRPAVYVDGELVVIPQISVTTTLRADE